MDGDNFKIPGYNLTKVNRQNKAGVGICIFTRDNIKIKLRNNLSMKRVIAIRNVCLLKQLNQKCKNIFGIICRPPSNKFNDFKNDLKMILTKLVKSDKPGYIKGDFNIDLLKIEML